MGKDNERLSKQLDLQIDASSKHHTHSNCRDILGEYRVLRKLVLVGNSKVLCENIHVDRGHDAFRTHNHKSFFHCRCFHNRKSQFHLYRYSSYFHTISYINIGNNFFTKLYDNRRRPIFPIPEYTQIFYNRSLRYRRISSSIAI